MTNMSRGNSTTDGSYSMIIPESRSSSSEVNNKRKIDDTAPNFGSQTDFANNFRRLRACARCHRLKMRCTFEDPTYESCTRCFKSGLKCSATDDPTESQAKSRPRKRTKLKGTGSLAQLQSAINESTKLFNAIQRGDYKDVDSENLNLENLTTLQFQISETQRLIFHAMNAQKQLEKNESESIKAEASTMNSMKDGAIKSIPSLPWISPELNIMKELIKLEIITTEIAKSKVDIFFEKLYIYWPCISFPKQYEYDWLLENEPLILLSFITVTCLNEPDLHDTLLYYLEDNLSIRTSVTGNISVSFIQIYLVLSLWCSPPRKWGSYKHQMSLLMALNLTLCLDLGHEVYKNSPNVLKDDSTERQMVRSYMAVYACCGSLGLSLPRFKVVNWTPVHERCAQVLLLGESNQADKFIYFYSKLVALGEEIFQYLCPNGFPNLIVDKESVNQIGDKDSLANLRSIMIDYEKRMQKLAIDSNLFTPDSHTSNLLSIIYYQLLMTMYDYVVCRVLIHRDKMTEIYLQTLSRLVKASEKVIDSFCLVCEQTPDFPTFFYYRPMHALVALIRARLLIKTQLLDLEVNIEQAYEKIVNNVQKISPHSKVANKMSAILTRISKWMKVSNKFNKNGATNSMVDLLNELGREKAIEKIKVNIKPNSNEGDNMNMSRESRIQFNNFINYGTGNNDKINNNNSAGPEIYKPITIINQSRSRIPGSQFGSDVDSDSIKPTISNIEDSSNLTFIPSPIGFSNSEIMQIPSTMSEKPDTNTLSAPSIFFGNNAFMPKHSVTRNSTSLIPEISQLTPSNQFLPYLGNAETSKINNMPSTSDSVYHNDYIPQHKQQQQQQQDFLNDIFSQIDTDIMGSQDGTLSNGLGVPIMFDFLGTGYQGGGDLPIPDDWYRTL